MSWFYLTSTSTAGLLIMLFCHSYKQNSVQVNWSVLGADVK